MVQKKNGKWQMCTYFTDLNKCYPKDDFCIARIDNIVNFAIGCEMMAFLNCFLANIKSGFVKKMRKRQAS
jgi:hypothetical protein